MRFIEKIKKGLRVGVVGDSMLDTYLYGKVSRISPEFPVPLLATNKLEPEYAPGGASNVAHQFQHFNAEVFLFSFLDKDVNFPVKFNMDHCITNGPIPRKIRFYHEDFPLLRYDVESPEIDNPIARKLLFQEFEKVELDVVILSNYSKGVFSPELAQDIISLCKEREIPTIVDSKTNPQMWKGCTVFKPNSSEAVTMTGKTDWKEQCLALREIAEKIVVTQQGNGVVGWDGDFFEYRPKAVEREVYSVIGAGDCFAAILALGVGHDVPLKESAVAAFEGGVQYVKSRHNRPITHYELHRRLDPLHAKLMTVEDIVYLRNGVYKDLRWVFTNGCFDLLHSGHLATLQEAKTLGDRVVVGINSDLSVRRLKGSPRPIQPLLERQQVIAALECIDFVVSFEEDTPYEVIKKLRPDVIVKGQQYSKEDVAGSDLVTEMHFVKVVPGNSTTNIVNKIKGEF